MGPRLLTHPLHELTYELDLAIYLLNDNIPDGVTSWSFMIDIGDAWAALRMAETRAPELLWHVELWPGVGALMVGYKTSIH